MKYLFLIIVIFCGDRLNCQQFSSVEDIYVCPPCNTKCDELEHATPGKCTHCGMALITKAEREKMEKTNEMTIAFYLQDGVEVLDFAGPMEVFSYAGFKVITVSKTKEPILSQGILNINPDYSIEDCPQTDILAFFGGNSGEAMNDTKVIEWIKSRQEVQYYFSVCTGAFLLGEAGLLDGQTATTFHQSVENLRSRYPKADVRADVRFVDNGRVITTAGISAGIDGALQLVQNIKGKSVAADVARYMEYDKWQPEEGLVMPGAASYNPGSNN